MYSPAAPIYMSLSLVSVVEREARRVVDDVHVVAEVALLVRRHLYHECGACVTVEPYALHEYLCTVR